MGLLVEQHPQVQKIINGILAGDSLRAIGEAVTPRVSHSAIQRYKRTMVDPTLKGAGDLARALQSIGSANAAHAGIDPTEITRAALAADPYLARIAKHRETIDASLADASTAKDGRTVAALVGVDLKGLELDARLTGRLDAAQGGTTNIYVVSAAVSLSTAGRPAQVIDVKASE